jgi:hypothetical protein
MEMIGLVLVLLVALFVVWKLGLFNPIVELSAVATRESSAYNREHKVRVAKRYENLTADIDVDKVNANIKVVDEFNFD